MDIENTNYLFHRDKQSEEKSLELAKLIQKAAKDTRANMAVQKECRELRDAQKKNDKDEMWYTFQKHLHDNAQSIKQHEQMIGITIAQIDREFYDKLTILDIKKQIELLIGAIHAIRIIKTRQEVFKECLKKLMKESRQFTKQEIEMVCTDRTFR